MTLERIVKTVGIDWSDTYIDVRAISNPLSFDLDLTPEQFIDFAQQDFREQSNRGIVNALTNAKRAIDCEIDRFLACIGYKPNIDLPENADAYIKRHRNLSGKKGISAQLNLLQALEVVPPKLVAQARRIRHLLEHEYKLPDEDKVEEAIEIADLFIGYMANKRNSFKQEFSLENTRLTFGGSPDRRPPDSVIIEYRHPYLYREGGFLITAWKDHGLVIPSTDIIISPSDDQYLELLKLTLAINSRKNITKALFNLLQRIDIDIPENKIKVRFGLLEEKEWTRILSRFESRKGAQNN